MRALQKLISSKSTLLALTLLSVLAGLACLLLMLVTGWSLLLFELGCTFLLVCGGASLYCYLGRDG